MEIQVRSAKRRLSEEPESAKKVKPDSVISLMVTFVLLPYLKELDSHTLASLRLCSKQFLHYFTKPSWLEKIVFKRLIRYHDPKGPRYDLVDKMMEVPQWKPHIKAFLPHIDWSYDGLDIETVEGAKWFVKNYPNGNYRILLSGLLYTDDLEAFKILLPVLRIQPPFHVNGYGDDPVINYIVTNAKQDGKIRKHCVKFVKPPTHHQVTVL